MIGVREPQPMPAATSRAGAAQLLRLALEDLADAQGDAGTYRIRWSDGTSTPVRPGRWLAAPQREEMELLAGAGGPVLDVGCGPGRHVVALLEQRVRAVGIDVLGAAVRLGRRRGAVIEQRSVFDPTLSHGRWATVLLLDGNVGIGGDPIALLRRAGDLLTAGGQALIELEPAGVGLRRDLGVLETPFGRSAPFPWGRVGADAAGPLAGAAGFKLHARWCRRGRWFARLIKTAGPEDA